MRQLFWDDGIALRRKIHGDIIIGMDGDEATVKRLLIKGSQVIFMPENPDFSPIYPEKPMVLGKVVGSYRKY